MPPGTEFMRSTTDHNMAEASKPHQVLIPIPSSDPADPLNWSLLWKFVVICNQAIFVLFSTFPTLSIAPVTPIFMKEFRASAASVSLFLGTTVIALGYANFIIIPFSNIYGRRAACLATAAILVGSNIWQALAKNTGSFFGARAMTGIGGAVNESVMVQVIADVFFLHERGLWMGVYFAAYCVGSFTGPIIAGNMAEYAGWRSFFWLCTGVSICSFICILFLFPETKFHRPGVKSLNDQSESITTQESKVQRQRISTYAETTEVLDVKVGTGKPRRDQWRLIQRPIAGAKSSLAQDVITPIYILAFPIVFWTAVMVGAAANTVLAMNLTQSTVFRGPPYNFSPGSVGFSNFAFVAGGLFGLATAGPFSDWIAKRLTTRNDDVREPEMRLLAILPYVGILILGCVVVGVGYHNIWPWQSIIIFGYTCIGIQTVALPTIAVAYAVDCYKPISGEILVICTVFKNTFGFGMSWWVPELQPMQSVMVLFACTAAAFLCGIPIYFYGKQLRGFTRNSRVHGMEAIM